MDWTIRRIKDVIAGVCLALAGVLFALAWKLETKPEQKP
jgi:hypothetical protein